MSMFEVVQARTLEEMANELNACRNIRVIAVFQEEAIDTSYYGYIVIETIYKDLVEYLEMDQVNELDMKIRVSF